MQHERPPLLTIASTGYRNHLNDQSVKEMVEILDWFNVMGYDFDKSRIVPFMLGRRTADKEGAFFAIFSTMIGAVEIARILPEPARDKVLATARDFLLRSS